jgi:hypothetical protein
MDPVVMQRLHIQLLSDPVERDDNVITIYRKSLLYFVSNTLEVDLRTPILGMDRVYQTGDYSGWDGSSSTNNALKDWRRVVEVSGLAQRMRRIDTATVRTALPKVTIAAAHGSFDNDIDAVSHTLEQIIGSPLPQKVDDLRGF